MADFMFQTCLVSCKNYSNKVLLDVLSQIKRNFRWKLSATSMSLDPHRIHAQDSQERMFLAFSCIVHLTQNDGAEFYRKREAARSFREISQNIFLYRFNKFVAII